MQTIQRTQAPGHYISYEQDPQYSRDNAVLDFGDAEMLESGTVLGMVTGSENPADQAPPPVVTAGIQNVGDGDFGYSAFDADTAKAFSIRFTGVTGADATPEAGQAQYKAYDAATGELIGTYYAGAAATVNGVTFTPDAGETPWAAGDTFAVAIPRQDRENFVVTKGTYKALDLAANDGTQNAAAILYKVAYADEGTRVVVTARNTQVKRDALIWPEGITPAQKAAAYAALAGKGITNSAVTIPV